MTRPANTVGGDFYDVIPLDDGRVLVTLGDVAGKGSPAALLMALLLAMLRTLVAEGLEPAELVTRLNAQVMKQAPTTRFITLFLGVYDPATGQLTSVETRASDPHSVSSQAPSTSLGARCTSTACHRAAVGPWARLRAAAKTEVCTIMERRSADRPRKVTGARGALPPR